MKRSLFALIVMLSAAVATAAPFPLQGQSNLQWDPTENTLGYRIGMSSDPAGPFVPVVELPKYQDNGAFGTYEWFRAWPLKLVGTNLSGQVVYWRVLAFNEAGASGWSNTVETLVPTICQVGPGFLACVCVASCSAACADRGLCPAQGGSE